MNKSWFYLGVIGSLAVVTTSCGGDAKPPTPAPTPAVTASPVATVPPTTPALPIAATPGTPTAPGTTPATSATTPGSPDKSVAVKPVSVDVAAGLIPPTDGESWAKTVSKGRSDPFGMLAVQPVEVIEPIDPLIQSVAPKQSSTATTLSPLPTAKAATSSTKIAKVSRNQRVASTRVSSSGNSQPNTVSISAIPRTGINRSLPKIVVALREPNLPKVNTRKLSSKSKTIAKLAPAKTNINSNSRIRAIPKIQPQTPRVAPIIAQPANTQIAAKPEKVVEKPLQAMAIEISGVIEVNGETQVIIKLPTESFSRYIAVGERIGNGRVLVKRVEGQNGMTPTVILEEVGVEVMRKIGEKSEPVN